MWQSIIGSCWFTLIFNLSCGFKSVHRTCWWMLRWWSCQQMDAGKVFKYSVSNWPRLKSPACSCGGYWLSRKLKHLNVEEDRCCWLRGLETTAKKYTWEEGGRHIFTGCVSDGRTRLASACFFFGVIKSRILYGAHLSPAAQRSVRKTTTALSPPKTIATFKLYFGGDCFKEWPTTAARDL